MVQLATDGSDIRLVSHHCQDRFCIPCQRRIASAICSNLNRLVEGKDVRFFTFTLRHSRTPLSAQLDRLYRSFKELRRRKIWTDSQDAGAAMLEVKLSEKDGLWHPHLHVLAQGSWVDQKELSKAWHEVTGDSSIVDVRRPASGTELVGYVTKYVTKPADASVYRSAAALDEAIEALRGRRRCLTFGAWRGSPLEDMPDDGREWQTLDSLESLLRRAAAGDVSALRFVEALERKIPDLLERWSGCPPDDNKRLVF